MRGVRRHEAIQRNSAGVTRFQARADVVARRGFSVSGVRLWVGPSQPDGWLFLRGRGGRGLRSSVGIIVGGRRSNPQPLWQAGVRVAYLGGDERSRIKAPLQR